VFKKKKRKRGGARRQHLRKAAASTAADGAALMSAAAASSSATEAAALATQAHGNNDTATRKEQQRLDAISAALRLQRKRKDHPVQSSSSSSTSAERARKAPRINASHAFAGAAEVKLSNAASGVAVALDTDDDAAAAAAGGKKRNPNAPKWVGPQKPTAANVRMISMFDYQPDICKDYKETGYCGYGDTCKFMHDRGDYKSGWQIDKEWDAKQALLRQKALSGGGDDDDSDDGEDDADIAGLPFACLICRRDFVQPVVTPCKHYFCEQCAMEHYRSKSTKCFVCKVSTNGIFNTAHTIVQHAAKLAKRRLAVAEAEAQKARDAAMRGD
jgi:RING finger protein 113A